MSQRFIIDTDPGVDDAQAILLAHANPGVVIEALTVVNGNVGLNHTLRNACRLVDVLGDSIPVYRGCDSALAWQAEDAAFVHGPDGFGGLDEPDPTTAPTPGIAANELVRRINDHPGEITLVCIGPLTNLALALKLDPTLAAKTGRLVIMGGAVTGRGNVSNLTAEFNVYTDPEAAHIVFSQYTQFDLVDWEATLDHAYSFEDLEGWLAGGSPRAEFYRRISAHVRHWVQTTHTDPKMRAADALAMAVAVEPGIVEQADERHVRIELAGGTRGMTVVDWEGRSGQPSNARIIRRVNYNRFLELNAAAFA